jgi:hypothetical protein
MEVRRWRGNREGVKDKGSLHYNGEQEVETKIGHSIPIVLKYLWEIVGEIDFCGKKDAFEER